MLKRYVDMTEGAKLTVDSIAKMTTYQLRGEVERRGLREDLKNIDHNSLMQRLIQVRRALQQGVTT